MVETLEEMYVKFVSDNRNSSRNVYVIIFSRILQVMIETLAEMYT